MYWLLIIFNLFSVGSVFAERAMNTDRPDKTESPYTVSRGLFQLETDILNLSQERSRAENTRNSGLYYNNINLKYGLTKDSDLQIVAANYVEQKIEGPEGNRTRRGFGDVYLRYKYNFFGNDEGDFALGIMPFVKFPTAAAGMSNNHMEGGIMLPFSIALPNEWSLGLMIQVDRMRREDDIGWQTDYVMSAALGRNIYGPWAGFVELFTRSSDRKDQGAITTFDLGLTYAVTEKIQLDGGAFFGLTEAADDFNPFLGLSVLF
jgi:hypothetical protein